jgi:hypothetical protein
MQAVNVLLSFWLMLWKNELVMQVIVNDICTPTPSFDYALEGLSDSDFLKVLYNSRNLEFE